MQAGDLRRDLRASVNTPLEGTQDRVIRAAVRWVNVEDSGSLKDLTRITNAQIELGRAVTALEKARKATKAK